VGNRTAQLKGYMSRTFGEGELDFLNVFQEPSIFMKN